LKETEKYLKELLSKSEWTAEEKKYLLDYLENSGTEELKEIMYRLFSDDLEKAEQPSPEISNRILAAIHEKTGAANLTRNPEQPVVKLWVKRLLAASVIVATLSSVVYLFLNKSKKLPVTAVEKQQIPISHDMAPGHDGAILTLADGKQIILDSAANGNLVEEKSFSVRKKDGLVVYNNSKNVRANTVYNTMTTPKGRQYQLVLADGSKVWLNAASSIRFPTTFTGKERRVEITGEAYFEVAKMPLLPFRVSVNGMEVEVLGTHFNINAYRDDAVIRTTLLEGRIVLRNGNNSVRLDPGQQGQSGGDEKISLVKNADTEEAIAWKEGRFLFKRTNVKTIMAQLTRWYDAEVVYQGSIPERFFTGDISRSTNLSQILMVLEESKIHFKIEGRKLIVMP